MFGGQIRGAITVSTSPDGAVLIKHTGKHGQRNSVLTAAALLQNPNQSVSYFEVTITAAHPACCIAVGLASADLGPGEYPGWIPTSIGLHGDDGGVHWGKGASESLCSTFGAAGDTIGCGLVVVAQNDTPRAFFTLNGRFVGCVPEDAVVHWQCENAHGVVALDAPAELIVTSNPKELKYRLEDLPTHLGAVQQGPPLAYLTTTESFNEFVTNAPLALVEFYKPVCAETVGVMFRDQIATAAVDMSRYPDLARRYVGRGALREGRALRMFRDGVMVEGPLPTEAAQLALYFKQVVGPACIQIGSRDQFVQCLEAPLVILAFFGVEDQANSFVDERNAFARAAEAFSHDIEQTRSMFSISFRRRVVFGVITTLEIAASVGMDQAPALLFVKDSGKEIDKYNGDMRDSNGIANWTNSNARVWVCALNNVTVKRVPEEKRRFCCFLFIDASTPPSKALLQSLRHIAAQPPLSETFNFFTVDSSNEAALDVRSRYQAGDSCSDFGILKNGKIKYVPPTWGTNALVTLESIMEFCARCVKGEAPVYLRSAPVPPEPSDNTVAIRPLVTSQFDRIREAARTRGQVVLFSAPWCQASPKIREVLLDAAPKYANVLDFHEIDVDANDAPIETQVEAVPTILIFAEQVASETVLPSIATPVTSSAFKFTAKKTPENIHEFLSTFAKGSEKK